MSAFDAFSEPNDDTQLQPQSIAPEMSKLARRETLVDISTIIVWVIASDLLLYHSGGFTALAVFLPIAAGILLLVKRTWSSAFATVASLGLLLACAVRLAWCGSVGAVVSGLALVLALSMCVNGVLPHVPDMFKYLLHVLAGSGFRLSRFNLSNSQAKLAKVGARFGVLLPAVVVAAFSLIFVLANPDVRHWISNEFDLLLQQLDAWLLEWNPMHLVFWILSGWLGLGLLHPAANYAIQRRMIERDQASATSENYIAVRNMLVSVVVLFAVYLVFEFSTLWFREFPEGFYYAGYAHEGAFWLTVALALATLVLSLAFRGTVLNDPRQGRLRMWAWIWSIENFLLGLAVIHRLLIYIDFNGMTRMRVVGLLGTVSVIIGFGLVVYKIVRGRDFLWLIRYQLLTVSLAGMLYTILPVDYAVHSYNAHQILAGNLAPSTQIPTHETSAEGLLPLVALLESDNAMIRKGMEATLADWLVKYAPANDWRSNQWVNAALVGQMEPYAPRLAPYLADPSLREQELKRFYDYAYQWY